MIQSQTPKTERRVDQPVMDSASRPLQGVIVPLVTPLLSCDELDVPGLDRLMDHVIQGGVHGIFLLGTTGESAALSGRLRRELVAHVCRQVEGRVPVLVGISDTSLVESLRLADDASQAGAAAVVVTAPYYLPLETRELANYVRTISNESPLPVYIYNMPELAKTWFSTDVLAELLDLENVAGLKDSSGDFAYFEQARVILSNRPDWSHLIGSESLMAEAICAGAHGCVAGGANIWPRLFVSLYEACLWNDEKRIAAFQRDVLDLSELYRFGEYAVGTIRGIKCALSVMSLINDMMAAPFCSANDSQRETIAEHLRRFDFSHPGGMNGLPHVSAESRRNGGRRYGEPAERTPFSSSLE